MRALSPHYRFKIFGKNLLEDVFFDDVDMIVIPGGIGDSESFHYLLRNSGNLIRQFVSKGGKYLGVCMGAYWAGKYYLDVLDGVDAVQYIKQPGTDTRRPHAKAVDVTWNGAQNKMFFYDGCALVGDATKFTTIATYANGDAMAIVQNNIGLIGCHPESEQFWYDGYSWLKGKYHQDQHHALLLEFVDNLMK
jgi:glutamine amidotransferase-like uncharacterized protein